MTDTIELAKRCLAFTFMQTSNEFGSIQFKPFSLEAFRRAIEEEYKIATTKHLKEKQAEIESLTSELMEQARIIGMGTERELKLNTEIESLKTQVLTLHNELVAWSRIIQYQYSGSKEAMSFLQECDNNSQIAIANTKETSNQFIQQIQKKQAEKDAKLRGNENMSEK